MSRFTPQVNPVQTRFPGLHQTWQGRFPPNTFEIHKWASYQENVGIKTFRLFSVGGILAATAYFGSLYYLTNHFRQEEQRMDEAWIEKHIFRYHRG